jgi:membrane-associated phospholipid phosphatase
VLIGLVGGVRRLVWLAIAATVLAVLLTYRASNTTLQAGSVGIGMLCVFGALLALAWYYRVVRGERRLFDACEASVQLMVTAGLFTLLGFGVAALGARFPLRDDALMSLDRSLGFSWQGYMALALAHPRMEHVLQFCYLSMPYQYVVTVLVLAFSSQRPRLDMFVLAIWISLVLTTAIFFVVPAGAAFSHFGITGADVPGLTPVFMVNRFSPLLTAMRAGGAHIVRLDDLEGLVTFPSFHTEMAVLFSWAAWRTRWIKWPILLVNLGMLAVTPIEGGHYLVDILAGAGVAAAALVLSGLVAKPFIAREQIRQAA